MFHGQYDLQLFDQNQNLVENTTFEVTKADCDLYGSQNILKNGKFETLSNWKTNNDPWPFGFSKKKYGHSYREPSFGIIVFFNSINLNIKKRVFNIK